MAKKSSGKAKFIMPPNILKEKAGDGGISADILREAEAFIASNPLDFKPHADAMLARFTSLVAEMEPLLAKVLDDDSEQKDRIDALTRPIMELKANSGMFGYDLLGEVAGIALNFLENIDVLNKDVFVVLQAHVRTMTIIVTSQLSGTGGQEGRALANELYQACNRYYKKYGIVPRG